MRPPLLGALLVERGLVTQEQLTAGLEEKRRSGRPLGDVLIGLGYVSAAAVAQALATQRGGVAKTEYGVAVGADAGRPAERVRQPPITSRRNDDSVAPLGAGLRLAPGAAVAPVTPESDAARASAVAAPHSWRFGPSTDGSVARTSAGPTAPTSTASPADEAVAELHKRVAALLAELDETREQLSRLAAERDRAIAAQAAVVRERDAAAAEAAAAAARMRALEAHLVSAHATRYLDPGARLG